MASEPAREQDSETGAAPSGPPDADATGERQGEPTQVAGEGQATDQPGKPIRAARRPSADSRGPMAAVARSFWEELVYPRARVKAALRRAEHHAKRYPIATSAALSLFIGLPFFMYVQSGIGRGIAAWGAFMMTAVFLIVGGPLLLIYAWPGVAAAVIGVCIWIHFSMGPGAVWLGVATISALLISYFATTEIVPFAAGAVAAWMARDSGTALAVFCFVAVSACVLKYRYQMTGPLIYAGWVWLSGTMAAGVATAILGRAMPAAWLRGPLPGPPGTSLWTATIAVVAALLVVPKKRRSAKKKRRTLAEQLPP